MEKSQQAMWDERYGSPEWAYGTAPNVYFRDKLSPMVPGKVLFPAEGEGRNAAFAASRGWTVEAFDISVQGKNKADRLAADIGRRITYVVADAVEVLYRPASIDVIVFCYTHFPTTVRATLFPKLAEALKPGGYVILECFGKRQIAYQASYASGGPKDVDFLFDLEEIRNLFPNYEIVELLEGEVALAEGKYHQGQAWVCRFFARKPL
jgi:SAM-dependent methyltransferase